MDADARGVRLRRGGHRGHNDGCVRARDVGEGGSSGAAYVLLPRPAGGTEPSASSALTTSTYCAYAAHKAERYSAYVCMDNLSLLQRVFWGSAEWTPREDRHGTLTWCGLHHLVYDGFKPRYKYFMSVQLLALLLLTALAAVRPATKDGCYTKTCAMTALLGLLGLFIVLARPYIALYENVMEGLICIVETWMLAVTLLAMKAEDATAHWGAEQAAHCAEAVMWLIVAKFVLDLLVFLKDELDDWRGSRGGNGSLGQFVLFFFCFKGAIDSREHYQMLHEQEHAKDCIDTEGVYYAMVDTGSEDRQMESVEMLLETESNDTPFQPVPDHVGSPGHWPSPALGRGMLPGVAPTPIGRSRPLDFPAEGVPSRHGGDHALRRGSVQMLLSSKQLLQTLRSQSVTPGERQRSLSRSCIV
eukprot:TRINITY_DN5671_c0_g1_i12.p2 TRINITY_DN5671_c0_g1~~TRINITY_DN5671_c0_g1_i12.p2  ORF type:complete len:415 (+),score=79.64 TRINITY_DN5671_c0_g1_i12:2580-3824(+)